MSVFVDTSALYAFFDGDDQFHDEAVSTLLQLAGQTELVTQNYVIVETAALLQRRLGQSACTAFLRDFFPVLDVFWVDERLHERAASLLAGLSSDTLSLVDLVSFEVMAHLSITEAFAFDQDFAERGFELVPQTAQ